MRLPIVLLQVLALVATAFPTKAPCDRAVLTTAADAYVAAQTAGSLTSLQPLLASNWSYVENNKDLDGTKGLLSKALKIDHRRTNYDLEQCATYSELVSASGPYVIGAQIWQSAGKITKIDVIASTTGSWLFNATKTLQYVEKETWAPLPAAQQSTREVVKAAGDAYLDMWSSSTSADQVPWGTPCVRLEGSSYTGTGAATDSCKPGIPSNHSQAPNTHRRYVFDQEMGSISIFCVWEHMMMAADSHEFRLEGGKVRYIHTITECGGKTCRL